MRRLLVLAGVATIMALALPAAPAIAESGRKLTRVCSTCHFFTKERAKFGPNLVKIDGRPIASVEGFEYTPALRALGGAWSRDRLIEFVNDPASYASGTAMKFMGFHDKAKAAKAIDYLLRRTNR